MLMRLSRQNCLEEMLGLEETLGLVNRLDKYGFC